MALRITQNLKKYVLPTDKKDNFNISAKIEETETTVNSDRDWEISDKTEEISVRGRLKENSHFWKNKLKPALFVRGIIDNGYIIPFVTIPPSFYTTGSCTEEFNQKPYCCNPLTVDESKKLRLV